MPLPAPGQTIIRSAQLVVRSQDVLAARLRLEAALRNLSVQLPNQPQTAILVVRLVEDRLLGRLLSSASGSIPESLAWERTFSQRMGALAGQAARPLRGPVPVDAPAVLFADHAELLACLAADLLIGLLPAHWWWRSLFPKANLPQAARAAWGEAPEELPAALALLARRAQAADFVRVLDRQMVRQMLAGLVHRFGLDALGQVFKISPSAFAPDLSTPQLAPVKRTQAAAPPPPSAPWHSLVPESAAGGLSIEQQTLLGIALTLRRAPMLARSRDFANTVHNWQQAVFLLQNAGLPQTVHLFEPGVAPTLPISHLAHTVTAKPSSDKRNQQANADSFSNRDSVEQYTSPPSIQPTSLTLSQPVEAPTEMQADMAPLPNRDPVEKYIHQTRPQPAPLTPQPVEAPTEMLEDQDQPAPGNGAAIQSGQVPGLEFALILPATTQPMLMPDLEEAPLVETVFTGFGGLFYLLNLTLLLGVYADFSAPLNPGLALSPWDFLSIIGYELAGPALESDPLWSLLAHLAGRSPDQAPGTGFEPPDGLSLAAWRDQTVLQIRLQLQLALRLEDESTLCSLFLEQFARIEHTSSRLDVFFSLAQHPIQIRLAGLDRDPWWIPAAGRYVVYHYD